MPRPSDEELQRHLDTYQKLIDIFPEPRRTKVAVMLSGKIGESYLTAPASSREEYHHCYPGGLLAHSLEVVRYLRQVAKAFAPGRFDDPTLAFVGLFHDLGKAGDGEQELYVPNPSDWHRQKGMLYETNRKCVYMSTAERGLFVLQKYGIVLTSDEYLAIRLNDGMYADENRWYRMKEPDLALLLHWADRWSAQLEKTGVEADS